MAIGLVDTLVKLGDFTFSSFEVPADIPFGGTQAVAVHRLVGGVKIIDALGPDDADLEWSGIFQSPDAVVRARHLDFLRKQGRPLELTWDRFRYNVLITEFRPVFERYYQVPYRVRCMVIEDLTAPIKAPPPGLINDAINADLAALFQFIDILRVGGITAAAQLLLQAIELPALLGSNSLLGAAGSIGGSLLNLGGSSFTAIADWTNLPAAIYAGVGLATDGVITAVQETIAGNIFSFNTIPGLGGVTGTLDTLGGVDNLGGTADGGLINSNVPLLAYLAGVVPGLPGAELASNLTGQLGAASEIGNLYMTQSVAERFRFNVGEAALQGGGNPSSSVVWSN